MELISKLEAKANGLNKYFTGKPCKHGHIAFRYVGDSSCEICQANRAKKWYSSNKLKSFENHYVWAARNRGTVNAAQKRYETGKEFRTPLWADQEAITNVYKECQEISKSTGILHHVDHIVPLHGRNISGLHVEYNLQIIPGKINQSKGNKLLAV